MSCSVGFRVFREVDRPDENTIRQFASLSTSDISDAMHRSGAMDPHVRAVDRSMRLAGPAITVRLAPGDNLMIYKALEICRKGDVLIIETRRSMASAIWGDRLSRLALEAGVAGMITDGCVRDRTGIRTVGLPVFANPARVANGAYKHGPGEVNTPVAVGSVVVLPGDLAIADEAGVVVVHSHDIHSVLHDLHSGAHQSISQPSSCEHIPGKWGGA
jgi:regulator of RNase E activity RraA